MLKIVLLMVVCSIEYVMADNQDVWNNAYNLGKNNQFNLNLQQNSTIDSYGIKHKFEPSFASNANAGASGSKDTYKAAHDDPNYLYNHGTAEIQNCKNKHYPRCSTLNKYGDADTQRGIQAYKQGFSERYYMSVSPDPSDKNCSIIHTKNPKNEIKYECNAGVEQHTQCHNLIPLAHDSLMTINYTIF